MSFSLKELEAELAVELPARDTMSTIIIGGHNFAYVFAPSSAVAVTVNSSFTATYASSGTWVVIAQG